MTNSIKRWLYFKPCGRLRRLSLTHMMALLITVCVVSTLILSYYASLKRFNSLAHDVPKPNVVCHSRVFPNSNRPPMLHDHTSSARLRIDAKVLIIVETQYSALGKDIEVLLESVRINYKAEIASHPALPYLTRMDKGKYGIIIFENFNSYLNMDKWNRELLDKYCREYSVGLIGFMPRTDTGLYNQKMHGFPLSIHTNLGMRDFEINPNSEILRVTRAGELYIGNLPDTDWTAFVSEDPTYQTLAYSKTQSSVDLSNYTKDIFDLVESHHSVIVQDLGKYDGIQRVLFGSGLQFWLNKMLFLDSISFLSHGKLSIPLERYILIDIDDIFVGKPGIQMKPEDVEALIQTQDQLRKDITGFRFNLGFSGKFFHRGTAEENRGDDLLLEYKNRFWWFGHMWRHTQAHLAENLTQFEWEMQQNFEFAKFHEIPIDNQYAVAPHHSGVFPVHEPLYDTWKKVWKIKVTSTEEYPHLRPARLRRGFIHKGIKVLPRQTCGLFTHTIFIDKYPGGRERLENSIRGGELFQSFVFNPINIFMTHLSNYGNDRLALYTFESVVKFVRCWTNFQMRTVRPMQLAKMYFDNYPEEEDPVWSAPCADKRHTDIWPVNKTCDRLPKFLVIGPQKTGTTALYTFLSQHPAIRSNFASPVTFEEVQFFGGNNYYKGIDWYMDYFPAQPDNGTSSFTLFEKSATYFDKDFVPKRIKALLPNAKLICILLSPARRAYSWYQHMRAHQDITALNYTFFEVISADHSAPKPVRDLRSRCLNPGLYAHHLEKWLTYFASNQILIIDGGSLKTDPIAVMGKVQEFIHIEPVLDYSNHIRYDTKKGFFCQVVFNNHTKCLGRSKGRFYPPMDDTSRKFLSQFYKLSNVALSKLLHRISQPIPGWLEDDLAE